MAVRLERQMQSGIEVARWLADTAGGEAGAAPGACRARPATTLWKRDFTGACSLFGVVFQPEFRQAAVHAMVESLELFGIGASWGGYESLALPTTGFITRTAGSGDFGGPMARLHIGLEEPADLIADLEQALSGAARARGLAAARLGARGTHSFRLDVAPLTAKPTRFAAAASAWARS